MCNLYTLKAERWEIDAYFQANNAWRESLPDPQPINYAEDVYKGYPGLVFAEGRLQAMAWGFPRKNFSKRDPKKEIKPTAVNNARDDQLMNRWGMWLNSFEQRRCLIPLTAFAEAEGPRGQTTRTWISRADQKIFCAPGIWRESDEWGRVYSMVTCAPCEQTLDIHDRSPVILRDEDHCQWLEGTVEEALALCVPWRGPLTINRTLDPWNEGRKTGS